MSDWQPPPQPYAPPPSAATPPTEPRPRRTGLIIAVVVVVLILLCCCMGVAGVLLFSASSNRTSNSTSTSSTPTAPLDPKEAARLTAWETAKATFPLSGYSTVAPDARQRKLADAATAFLFPDFALDELLVHPGSYDAKKQFFTFDEYIVLMHLKSDPAALLARSYSVTQPAADSLKRERITLDPNEALARIGGTSWLHYDTDKVPPLSQGIKDPRYAELLGKVAQDWPGGVTVRLVASSDGSAKVRIFTWASYSLSNATAYIDAVYVRTDGVWGVQSYDIVDESSTTPTTTPAP